MRYCLTCKKDVEDDEEICRTCGNPTVSGSQGPEKKRPMVRRILTPAEGGAAEVVPFKVVSESTPKPERHEQPVMQKASEPAEASRPRTGRFEGEAKLEAFLAQGYEIYLIAGIAGVGKTELLSSFRQDGFLESIQKKDGRVMPTALNKINSLTISFGGRKILFADASGENFRLLYPDADNEAVVTEADIGFLKLIAKGLRGVILLVELERLWDERTHSEYPADGKQVQILSWILSILRWLTIDGRYNQENNPIRFTEHVDAFNRTVKKRLKVPVQVLYSKADRLRNYPIPRETARTLSPTGEDPLLFTYHCMERLYNSIDTHADYYRFDFAHSLVTKKGPGTILENDPCGVALAIQWLLDPSWSSRFTPMIPTRRWVTFQRFVDRALGHGRRWERLPNPKEPRA